MGCSALKLGEFHGLVEVVTETDWHWGQTHQRPVSIVESLSFIRVLGLFPHKLPDGDGDVSTQSNRVGSAAVVESMV